MDYLV